MRTIDENTHSKRSARLIDEVADLVGSQPAGSNDNGGAGGAVVDTTHLLAHPDLVLYLRATLRNYGVDTRDDDALGEVQALTLEVVRGGRMPANLREWKALVATIAAGWAIDGLRHEEVRDKYDVGLCDDPDPYEKPTLHWEGRDPVDTKRYLGVLKQLFDEGRMPAGGAEILWGEAEHVPHEDIAAELGLTTTVVDNRLHRMRATFRRRLAALGLLSFIVLLGTLVEAPLGGVATREVAPPRPQLVQVVTAEDRAALFRREGLKACDAGRWPECLSQLDAAAKLDPAGDGAPEIRAARGRAQDALYEEVPMLEAKPR